MNVPKFTPGQWLIDNCWCGLVTIASIPEMYYCLKELKAALVDNASKSYSEARFDYEMAVQKMKIIIKNVEG